MKRTNEGSPEGAPAKKKIKTSPNDFTEEEWLENVRSVMRNIIGNTLTPTGKYYARTAWYQLSERNQEHSTTYDQWVKLLTDYLNDQTMARYGNNPTPLKPEFFANEDVKRALKPSRLKYDTENKWEWILDYELESMITKSTASYSNQLTGLQISFDRAAKDVGFMFSHKPALGDGVILDDNFDMVPTRLVMLPNDDVAIERRDIAFPVATNISRYFSLLEGRRINERQVFERTVVKGGGDSSANYPIDTELYDVQRDLYGEDDNYENNPKPFYE